MYGVLKELWKGSMSPFSSFCFPSLCSCFSILRISRSRPYYRRPPPDPRVTTASNRRGLGRERRLSGQTISHIPAQYIVCALSTHARAGTFSSLSARCRACTPCTRDRGMNRKVRRGREGEGIRAWGKGFSSWRMVKSTTRRQRRCDTGRAGSSYGRRMVLPS